MRESPLPSTTRYTLVRSQVYDEGLRPLGACDDSSPAQMVRVQAPTETMTITWTATREGAAPICPSHVSTDPNYVFIGGSRGNVAPGATENGRQVWSLNGCYVYQVLSPLGLGANFPSGKMPWEPGSASDNTIPASYFQQGIIGPDPRAGHGHHGSTS